jgi:polyhydroxybutyrate depolymerase
VTSPRFASLGLVVLSIAALAACSSGNGAAGPGGPGGTGATGGAGTGSSSGGASSTGTGIGGSAENPCAGGTVGGDRPVQVHTFTGYDCKQPAPLVLLLHDYGSTGAMEEAYFDLAAQSDAQGFLYVHPDGTKDTSGKQFWNATDACCDAGGAKVDDSGYLSALISGVQSNYNVDPKRIYVVGHGNGGFMAYRLACDHASQVTAVASLGGATWNSSASCPLKTAVSVVEIHGTADATFAYGGGTHLGHAYPSAMTTASDWATLDHCKGAPDTSMPPLDLDATLSGAETTVTHYGSCFAGSTVELWSIMGGSHAPTFASGAVATIVKHLLAQTRP